jgi:hypothetical protein
LPTQFQFRRGTATQNDAFLGANGEISVDLSNKSIRVHDGVTTGGFELANTTSPVFLNSVNIQGALANTFTVGLNGATNPAFTVDTSTASSATGFHVKSAAAGGGVAIKAASSGTNESLIIDAKGSGNVSIATTSTGVVYINEVATVVSAGSQAFTVGANGQTNPALTVDASTVSSATGVSIKSAAAAGGVAIATTSSGTNENLTIDAKGSGTITLGGTSTGAIALSRSTGITGAGTITSASASALTVGLNGATNPALTVDASTASSATGVSIKSAAAGAGAAIAVTSSGTNENLTVDAKGSGTITVGGTSTGAIALSRATTITTSATVPSIIGGTGTGSSLTIQSTSGVGATDTVVVKVGNNGATTAGTFASTAAFLQMGAGTNAIAPLKFTTGTNLSAAAAGAVEYDGSSYFQTGTTTLGRGVVPVTQHFKLTADGAAIGPAIANFFGATSGVSLETSAYYELEADLYFTKTTAGTVTFTLTFSNAPISASAYYNGTAVGGVGTAAAGQTAALVKSTATAAALPATGSLTTAVNHQYKIVALFQANATTAGTLNLQITSSAGTVTPLALSSYKVRRIPTTNTGTFA